MTASAQSKIPAHLRKYIVDQNYSRYTPEDQSVWRYIMRQLKNFLSVHAHSSYVEGLKKTGIQIERIPEISSIDEHLERFGWGAIPVSGFIPPAAFMEFQSLGILPIASDMRTLAHLQYTPAPDIVHEAAGHAPILAHPEYAAYLLQYGEVATHAIINRQDLEQYEAIRKLSDIKEDPHSSAKEIKDAEEHLESVSVAIKDISEAALLSRMNWWTAEYGLIGDLKNPKIFGAGLLSSVGESRTCLSPKVTKIPLTVNCITYSYNITEPQPQLFVAESFGHLGDVLENFAAQMSYRKGGLFGLKKAQDAHTVNTVQLNSGLQISGVLKNFDTDMGAACFLKFDGPSQLAIKGVEIVNQGPSRHPHGFSSPVGLLRGQSRCLSAFSESDLRDIGLSPGDKARLEYQSGLRVEGRLKSWIYQGDRLILLTFIDCKVSRGDQILFDPAWGEFDMAVGSQVVSVFGGPADRSRYGQTEDFIAERVPNKTFSQQDRERHAIFDRLAKLRQGVVQSQTQAHRDEFGSLCQTVLSNYGDEWLLALELLEVSYRLGLRESDRADLLERLNPKRFSSETTRESISDGLALAEKV